jgi:acetylornithine deacetylase
MAPITQILGFMLLASVRAAPQASAVTVTPSASAATATATASASAGVSLTTEEREELFTLHEDLVNIPSISHNETECAEWLTGYLEDLGYYVEKVPVGNTDTFNVFAYSSALREEGVWPEVLITSHIDTVSCSIC